MALFFFCFIDRASRYMRVMKPTCCTIYVQFKSPYLYVFGLASIPSSRNNSIYMRQLVCVVCLCSNQAYRQSTKTYDTICCKYTLLPHDDPSGHTMALGLTQPLT
jgi:hypothetical protein